MSESNFIQKVGAACNKKEDLYQKSKTRYAVRSIFAGGFLTLSTAVGAVAADLLNSFVPGTGRFLSVSYTHLDVYKRQHQKHLKVWFKLEQ